MFSDEVGASRRGKVWRDGLTQVGNYKARERPSNHRPWHGSEITAATSKSAETLDRKDQTPVPDKTGEVPDWFDAPGLQGAFYQNACQVLKHSPTGDDHVPVGE